MLGPNEDLVLGNMTRRNIESGQDSGNSRISALAVSTEQIAVERPAFSKREPDRPQPPTLWPEFNPSKSECSCSTCPADQLNLCAVASKAFASEAKRLPAQTIPARRTICHPKDWSEFVLVICDGWAASSIMLADGRRQILSFLLPGDLVSTASIFGATSGRLVEAVTKVTYRKFNRDVFKAALVKDPDFLEKVSKVWIEEREHTDQLAADLGRRTADARIARQVLYLASKLGKRGMMRGQTLHFPLRHRHIADATGLTQNHVSKVMSCFQKAGLIKITNRSLTITNEAALRHAADWQ